MYVLTKSLGAIAIFPKLYKIFHLTNVVKTKTMKRIWAAWLPPFKTHVLQSYKQNNQLKVQRKGSDCLCNCVQYTIAVWLCIEQEYDEVIQSIYDTCYSLRRFQARAAQLYCAFAQPMHHCFFSFNIQSTSFYYGKVHLLVL